MNNKITLHFIYIISLFATMPVIAQPVRVVPFINNGGRVDWAKGGIAYDFLDSARGFYELAIINPDGSGYRNLTKGVANIPQKHNGNPAWSYPDSRYIVYEAEKDSNYDPADAFYGSDANATPGIGLNVDLWVVDLQTSTFTRLTNLPTKRTRLDTTPTSGLFHPQFSHDGKKLLWAQCLDARDTSRGTALPGLWELNISDFDTTGGVPQLTNTVHYTTGGVLGDFTFLETSGGFSPDDSTVIYCANAIPGQLAGYMDIWGFNFYTNQVTNLTPDSNVWDEHSHYTYDGSHILWMNSTGYTFIDDVTQVPKTDYWLMDKDGSNKKQVTFFNNPDSPDHVYAAGGIVTVGDNAWSPFGGDTAVCYVQIFGATTSRSIFYLINTPNYIDTVSIDTATSISSLTVEQYGFTYYPNPVEDKVTLDLSGLPSESMNIRICGMNGDILYNEQVNNAVKLHTINTSRLSSGLYFIQVVSGSLVLNKKLIIQ